MLRQSLDFVAKVWTGVGDEPTEEKPISERSVVSGKTETVVKKVLNVGYEERLKAMAEESKKIAEEAAPILERLKAQAKAKRGQASG